MSHAQISAAKFRRNAGLLLCETLHVYFVNDGFLPRRARWLILAPIEVWIRNDRSRDIWSGVEIIPRGERPVKVMAEHCFAPVDFAENAFRVRIQQQLCRITTKTVRRRPGSMDSKTVSLSGTQAGDVAMPAQRRHFGQVPSCLAISFIKEAKLDAF